MIFQSIMIWAFNTKMTYTIWELKELSNNDYTYVFFMNLQNNIITLKDDYEEFNS